MTAHGGGLTAAFSKRQKQRLQSELRGLPTNGLRGVALKTIGARGETLGDTLDQALVDAAQATDVVRLNGKAAAVQEVLAALERLAGGSYGVCEACGEAIGRKRLEAVPAARYCVRCQSSKEKESRAGEVYAAPQAGRPSQPVASRT